MWFDQEDDFDDTDAVMSPMTDPLKATKYDADFEQINIKFLERSKTGGTNFELRTTILILSIAVY